jgi:hypothetical protein
MLISELIAELEKFKAENGDIEATILSDYGGYYSFECFIGIDEEADEDNKKVVVFY